MADEVVQKGPGAYRVEANGIDDNMLVYCVIWTRSEDQAQNFCDVMASDTVAVIMEFWEEERLLPNVREAVGAP